jgi:hypothetical protein
MFQYIPLFNFLVGLAALGVLVWYTIETMRLRTVATDQVEAMSKPCLTIWADLRDPTDAILEMDDAVGGTVARGDDGNFVVQNIGTGVALNVRYHFNSIGPPKAKSPTRVRYFVNVLPAQKVRMPEPMNASIYCETCEVVFCFESIGSRRYQSTVTMINHVLTGFEFKRI